MSMKRPRGDQEIIEETIDGEMMEWDLQDLGWESSTDHLELDPRQDHDHDDHSLVLLDFTNSTLTPPQKSTSQSSEANNNNTTPPSSGGPPKRAIGAQKMSCLVDGCNADLSGCRDYHRRHRVCERHSKAPIVSVKGEEKRFCQQCSRFHSLGEFDEVKRSCRKRLDGHNRRRRKSQPEPLYFSSKSFLSGYKGPRILQFGNPHIYATASVRTLWPVETKTEPETWLYSPHKRFQATNQPSPQTRFSGKSNSLKGNNYYQQSSAEQFLCCPFEPPHAGRGRNKEHHGAVVSSSFNEEISLPIDSGGRALYLLSTNPTPHPSESCSVQLLDYDPKDKAVPDYPFPTTYYNIANKTITDNDVNVYALRMGPDSLLEHGALQMLPISLE